MPILNRWPASPTASSFLRPNATTCSDSRLDDGAHWWGDPRRNFGSLTVAFAVPQKAAPPRQRSCASSSMRGDGERSKSELLGEPRTAPANGDHTRDKQAHPDYLINVDLEENSEPAADIDHQRQVSLSHNREHAFSEDQKRTSYDNSRHHPTPVRIPRRSSRTHRPQRPNHSTPHRYRKSSRLPMRTPSAPRQTRRR